MSVLFDLSYVALCAVVVAQSLVLQKQLRDALWLKHMTEEPEDSHYERMLKMLGTQIPDFDLRVLGSSERVTAASTRGEPTLMLFVIASEATAIADEVLLSTIAGLLGKVDRHLYVVGIGTEEQCLMFDQKFRLRQRFRDSIRLLIDEGGRLSHKLDVRTFPAAVMWDESGRLQKVGRLTEEKPGGARLARVSP